MTSGWQHCVALIGDLVGSRAAPDRRALHHDLTAALAAANDAVPALRPLAVTVGDEFQGVFATLGHALAASYRVRAGLVGRADARFGLGRGAVVNVDEAAGIVDGSAWWAARAAIEDVESRASSPTHAAVRVGVRADEAEPPPRPELSAALATVDLVLYRIDDRSRRIAYALAHKGSQKAAADAEGVSPSAISQRVRRDGLELLAEAIGTLGGLP